jgi:SAM-dependent methyltransferase
LAPALISRNGGAITALAEASARVGSSRGVAKPYYAEGGLSAAFYDLITAADASLRGDTDVYARLPPPGGEVLELGAGTGRVAADLAGRGLSVTGVEIAPGMLAQAQARLQRLPPEVAARIELRRGDMTSLNLRRTFDLVICPFFTLAHVPAGAAWRNTFATAARHLRAGGRAAFHLPKLEVMRLPGPGPDLPVMDQPLHDGRRLRLYVRERRFREELGRLEQVIEYVVVESSGAVAARSPERLTYWMADPLPFAAAAGLAPDRPPVELGGVGHIWTFEKR